MSVPPILIFGYGNPSRGDDAIGPEFLRRIEPLIDPNRVELLTDFQLQIEHALDLRGRDWVLFVDASRDAPEPFDFAPLQADSQISYSTHEMAPAAVLAVFTQVQQCPPPPCYLLAIRGYTFELGQGLSPRATANLTQAVEFTLGKLAVPR
jgi:hydrogenase maturation protease